MQSLSPQSKHKHQPRCCTPSRGHHHHRHTSEGRALSHSSSSAMGKRRVKAEDTHIACPDVCQTMQTVPEGESDQLTSAPSSSAPRTPHSSAHTPRLGPAGLILLSLLCTADCCSLCSPTQPGSKAFGGLLVLRELQSPTGPPQSQAELSPFTFFP